MLDIRRVLKNYKRVLKVAKKPGSKEFLDSARICVIGMALIGLIGFVVYLISVAFLGW